MFSKNEAVIKESLEVDDIIPHCTHNSLVAFDLDNTIFRPMHCKDLGSDQFFSFIIQQAFKMLGQTREAVLLAVALSDEIQKIIDVKPVQEKSSKLIKALQATHIPVIGLTARGFNIGDITLRQLNQVNVQFTSMHNDALIKLDVEDKTRNVYYYNGVIFCDGADKGKCLMEFYHVIGAKYNVVMVDDTEKNLIRVKQAAMSEGLSFFGLRYGKMDDRTKNFQMFRALKKFNELRPYLSPNALRIAERLNLEKDFLLPKVAKF